MAETAKGKKWIRIKSYVRGDGTRVPAHDRSTLKTSKGPTSRHSHKARGRATR
jgi:hypothetical protein